MTLDKNSQYYTSQLLVVEDLQSFASFLDKVGNEREGFFNILTSTYFANDVPDYLIEVTERVTSIKDEYNFFSQIQA